MCLLLGLALTVAIAWLGVVVLLGPTSARQVPPPERWPVARREGWPNPEAAQRFHAGVLLRTMTVFGPDSSPYLNVRSSGWPRPAMASAFVVEPDQSHTPIGGLLRGVALPDAWVVNRTWGSLFVRYREPRLPLRPTWPGFVLDVAFYWILCWASIFGLGALRRRLRRRRDRCVVCGYDLAGLAACPECGAGHEADARRKRERSPKSG